MDNTYGTRDDFIDNGDGTNLRPGKDLVYGTEDDELWSNGKNNIAGDYDDYLKKYPNRKYTGGSSGGSGGGGGGSGIIGGSSNVLYGGLVSSSKNGPTALTAGTRGLAGGTWTLLDAATHKWTYSYQGFTPKNQWAYVYWDGTGKNSWYFFDSEGIMKFGWFYGEDNEWYHLHAVSDGNLGAMDLGFFYEAEDKQWYYLNTTTGEALTGWQNIDNKWYFFNKTVQNGQTWFWNSDLGRWVYQAVTGKPYGAMYHDEKTPDGFTTDSNGVSEDYKSSGNAMSYVNNSSSASIDTAASKTETTTTYVKAGAIVN